jgi:hypothetical protein
MRGSASLLQFACLLTLVASVDRWFLNIFIPLSCAVFSAIPPVILIPCFWVFAPDAYEELQATLNSIEPTDPSLAGVGVPASMPDIKTKRDCKCKFPFTFGGQVHKSCTRVDGTFLAGEPETALWCDTGPGCGLPYTEDDRPFTDRKCCYDVCVDGDGKTLEGNAMPGRN